MRWRHARIRSISAARHTIWPSARCGFMRRKCRRFSRAGISRRERRPDSRRPLFAPGRLPMPSVRPAVIVIPMAAAPIGAVPCAMRVPPVMAIPMAGMPIMAVPLAICVPPVMAPPMLAGGRYLTNPGVAGSPASGRLRPRRRRQHGQPHDGQGEEQFSHGDTPQQRFVPENAVPPGLFRWMLLPCRRSSRRQ
jgi:hypothetical protein